MLNFLIVYVVLFTLVGHVLLVQKFFRYLKIRSAVNKTLKAAPAAQSAAAPGEQLKSISDGENFDENMTAMLNMFSQMMSNPSEKGD